MWLVSIQRPHWDELWHKAEIIVEKATVYTQTTYKNLPTPQNLVRVDYLPLFSAEYLPEDKAPVESPFV